MTADIKYVTRCSYCHANQNTLTKMTGETVCYVCGKRWTPEMVKITTEKVEVDK